VSICVEFFDEKHNKHVYTVLNTSRGKKGSNSKVYYKPDNPKKVYALNWFNLLLPILLFTLGAVLFVV
jgi:hypothetical protein